MSSIHDLINLSSNSTGAASASPSTPNTKQGLVSSFIGTLLKYAQPAMNTGDAIVNGAVNTAKDLGNATAYTAGQWAQVPGAIANQVQGKPIQNNYTPPNESQQRGLDTVAGMMTPTTTLPVLHAGAQGVKPAAAQAEQGVNDAVDAARTQPGGLQAGYVKFGKAEPAAAGEKPPMITKTKADDKAVANYLSLFDVTRSRAHNMLVSPQTVINQLIDDGITHVKGIDDLENVSRTVTGRDGAVPTINNHVLSQVTSPLDYQPALDAITDLHKNVLDGEKPGFQNEVKNEVNKAFTPVNYNNVGLQGAGYAKDLYQTSQNLRDLQLMYKRQAYTAMGELQNPEYLRASNSIGKIKDAVDSTINGATKDIYQKMLQSNDPVVQEQLQRLRDAGAGKVADRLVQGAQVFKDGQAIQAPYFNLQKMIDDTRDTQMSVWTKAAKAMQDQRGSSNVGQTVAANTPGPAVLKNIVGGIAQKGASAFDRSPEQITQDLTSGEVAKKSSGKGLKILGTGAALTAGTVAGVNGLEALNNKSNADSEPYTNQGDNSHTSTIANSSGDVNTLPTNMQDIKPDPKTGTYSVSDPTKITGSDGNSLAITKGQAQTALAQLDALVKQDPSYITNPIKAGQLKAAQEAIQQKAASSQTLMDSFQKNAIITQKIADAQELLKKTHPVLSDKLGFMEGAHQMVDPAYQSLINDFNFIESSDPRLKGQLSNLATSQSAKVALENAAKLLLSEHNQLLKSYGAGTSASDTTAATQPTSQLPSGLAAPVNGQLPAIQKSGWQQLGPADTSMQLTPIGGQ